MTLKAAILILVISLCGCSLVLDPALCESDADCNGGVCQVGICIGDELTAGEAGTETVDMMSSGGLDQSSGGSEAGTEIDMDLAGEMSGGEFAGQEGGSSFGGESIGGEELFECGIISSSLTRAGATLRDLPPELDGSTHWLTAADDLVIELSFTTPNSELWRESVHVYLGDQELEIIEENESYLSTLVFEREGEHRARLVIGDEADVRCVDQLFITVDRSAPSLQLVSPSSPETWIGELSGSRQTRVTLETRDITRVALSILDSTNTEIAQREPSDELTWSTDIALREGENHFTVMAKDELDFETSQEITFHYDALPPGIGLSEPASTRITLEENSITLSGFIYQRAALGGIGGEGGLEIDARIIATSYRDHRSSGDELHRRQGRSDQNGAFSLIIPLETGLNEIQLCAYDRAENETCVSLFVTRVESQPCVNITSSRFSANSLFELRGDVCPSVSGLTLTVNGGASESVMISEDLSFTRLITLSTPGVENALRLTARSEDGQSATAELQAIWDDSPPIVLISSPSSGSCSNQEMIEVCARVLDPESDIVSLRLNNNLLDLSEQYPEGESWWENFCTTIPLNIPSSLDHFDQQIRLLGRNGAGSETEFDLILTVDRTPPQIVFDPAPYENWYRPDRLGRVTLTGQVLITGCSLTSTNPIELNLTSGENGTVTLEAGSRFRYLAAIEDGDYELNAQLTDRAGNYSTRAYQFSVDRQGPTIDLISPATREVSSSPTLNVVVESTDTGSGLLISSGVVRGLEEEQVLNARVISNDPLRYELSAPLHLNEGFHELSVVLSDHLGNESTLDFTYILDQTPPTIHVISPRLDSALPDHDSVLLEVYDELSVVTEVSANGIIAERRGELWFVEGLNYDPQTPLLELEANDEAGNLSSEGSVETRLPVTLSPLTWQGPERLNAPSRGLLLSSGELSEDTAVNLGAIDHLIWTSGFGADSERLSMYSIEEDAPPSELTGVSVSGVSSLVEGRITLQSELPSGQTVLELQRATIRGVLTLFTLHRPGPGEISPTLHLWQRYSELRQETEIVGNPVVSPDTWVPVRLGLPPTLNATVWALGDVTGDGRLDLISCNSTGAFLFRQSAEGRFVLEGQTGLSLKGINGLGAQTQALWWIDLNGDGMLDLIAQSETGLHVWFTALNGGEYQFTESASVPPIAVDRSIDGWMRIDWDQDGELDTIAWSSGDESLSPLIRRYEVDRSATVDSWSVSPILDDSTLPSPLIEVLLVDLDLDRVPELLTLSPNRFAGYEANNDTLSITLPELPMIGGSPALIDGAVVADFDQDGDEDLLFALRGSAPESAEDAGNMRGELWALNLSATLQDPSYSPLRLTLKRFNAAARDSLGVSIHLDQSGGTEFNKAFVSRPFSETIINSNSSIPLSLQVIFPDFNNLGGNTLTEYAIESGSSLVLIDDQE